MTITAFDRTAQPCVRFDSEDIIKWADYKCGCGRKYRIAKGGVVGRADDITKVKGVLLAASAIAEVVREKVCSFVVPLFQWLPWYNGRTFLMPGVGHDRYSAHTEKHTEV